MNRELVVEIRLGEEGAFRAVDEFRPGGSGLATFGMRPYAVRVLPDNWSEVPGVAQLLGDLASRLPSAPKLTDLDNAILAPIVAKAAADLDLALRFDISLDGFLEGSEQVIGLRLKYLINVLNGTREFMRRITIQPPMSNTLGTPILVKALALCEEASRDEGGLNAGAFDDRIEALRDELAVLDQMANAVDLAEDRIILSWPGGQSAEPYAPTGGWQSIRIAVKVARATAIQFDPSQTPCYFWVRKVAWHLPGGERPATLTAGRNGVIDDIDGTMRLTAFGPGPAVLKGEGAAELEIEFLVQASDLVIKDIVLLLKARLHALTQGMRR